jgi:hypothetical protein
MVMSSEYYSKKTGRAAQSGIEVAPAVPPLLLLMKNFFASSKIRSSRLPDQLLLFTA